jgi:hypothetical protein
MNTVKIYDYTNDFAENKDVARKLRLEIIQPELQSDKEIILDFAKVTSATQSFIHALLSQIIRDFGVEVLEKIGFKNCNENVKTIIEIVIEYVQDGIFTDDDL